MTELRGLRLLSLAAAFALYAALVYLCAARHQPWFDEAQSWLLARDLTPARLVFHQMRYEGSPPLWPLLLMGLQKLGLTYRYLNEVSATLGIVGIGLFLWKSPFPLAFRLAVPFCYFLLFQFAVIARSYALYFPLLVAIACFYPRRAGRSRLLYFLLLVLLACVSVHGALIAAPLFFEWFWTSRRLNLLTLGLFAVAAMALYIALFFELRFPPDLLTQLLPVTPAGRLLRALQQIREAFFGGMASNWSKLAGTLAGLLVIALSIPFFRRRRVLILYLGMTCPLLGLALFRATYWHAGVLFLVWIFTLWLSWPHMEFERVPRAVLAAIAAVVIVQVAFGLQSVWFSMHSTFSGSRGAARYLAATGEDRLNLFAVEPESFAIQPYFNRNLFAQQERGRTEAFYPWTVDLNHESLAGLSAQKTDRVIFRYGNVGSDDVLSRLKRLGYCEERRFPGAIWWKYRELEPDTFIILRPCTWPAVC